MPIFNIHSTKDIKDFPSVLLLYGADAFTMNEILNEILKMLLPTDESRVDYDVLDGEDVDQSQLVNLASQYPMLSEYRVIVVRRFDRIFKERKKKGGSSSMLANYLSIENPSTKLILLVDALDTKIDPTKYPYDLLIKQHSYKEFPIIYEDKLPIWVVNRFKVQGKSVDLETAMLVVSQTDPNLYNLANEVDKIILFNPKINEITLDYVLSILGSNRQNTVFELTKAVANKNLSLATNILLNIIKLPNQEMVTFNRLNDLFVKMWKLVEINAQRIDRKEMALRIGLGNSYFLNDYLVGISKYTAVDINNAFIVLSESEEKIKSTGADTKLILEEILLAIMN